jgi:hypothetical protein
VPTPEQVAASFQWFAEEPGLPLYNRLSVVAAGEPWLCELLSRAKRGQARPVLLLAAVHRLVLDHPDDELAKWYPSVTGGPVPAGDPGPAFLAFCRVHEGALTALVETRSTQTNEVNRSVAIAAILRVATADLPEVPVALVELGPSAGLNLRADTYCIALDDGTLHQETASAVRLYTRLEGQGRPDFDAPIPPIVARVGLDLDPIDVRTDTDDVAWLEACLWPEQLERFQRFRAAVELARSSPPTLVRGDLLDDLPAVLDGLPRSAHAFVFHSWVLTYVARERRPELERILRVAARERPLSWCSAEGNGVVPGVEGPAEAAPDLTVLGLTTMRGDAGRTTVLGTCHPHLAWLRWGASAGV